jgi:hypothetical protein
MPQAARYVNSSQICKYQCFNPGFDTINILSKYQEEIT